MNIGITCYSTRHPVVNCLAARLAREFPEAGLFVVRVKRSRLRVLRDVIDRYGFFGVVRETAARLGGGQASSGVSERAPLVAMLREYGEQHGLGSWHETVEFEPIRVGEFSSLNDPAVVPWVRAQRIELLINMGGGIFRSALIDAVPRGILNAHHGPLPAIRGTHAIEWTLFSGEQPEVTAHMIDEGIDTGDILFSRPILTDGASTIAEVRARALVMGIDVLLDAVGQVTDDAVRLTPQDPDAGCQYYVMHPRLRERIERSLGEVSTNCTN